MEDIYVNILNKYVNFYKTEIKKLNIFDNINYNDFCSTNNQLELLNSELELYKKNNEEFLEISEYSENNTKKYVITKNDEKILISNSLISSLIEIINLENENENKNINYKLKFNNMTL